MNYQIAYFRSQRHFASRLAGVLERAGIIVEAVDTSVSREDLTEQLVAHKEASATVAVLEAKRMVQALPNALARAQSAVPTYTLSLDEDALLGEELAAQLKTLGVQETDVTWEWAWFYRPHVRVFARVNQVLRREAKLVGTEDHLLALKLLHQDTALACEMLRTVCGHALRDVVSGTIIWAPDKKSDLPFEHSRDALNFLVERADDFRLAAFSTAAKKHTADSCRQLAAMAKATRDHDQPFNAKTAMAFLRPALAHVGLVPSVRRKTRRQQAAKVHAGFELRFVWQKQRKCQGAILPLPKPVPDHMRAMTWRNQGPPAHVPDCSCFLCTEPLQQPPSPVHTDPPPPPPRRDDIKRYFSPRPRRSPTPLAQSMRQSQPRPQQDPPQAKRSRTPMTAQEYFGQAVQSQRHSDGGDGLGRDVVR